MNVPSIQRNSIGNPVTYTPQAIENTLRLTDGTRKISFRYDLLNRHDIKIGELDGITRAKISYGEFRAIKRSASFGLNEYQQKNINYLTDQIQPWFVLHMSDGGTIDFPLGIFLIESPAKTATGKICTRDIGAYDKTIIVEQDKLMRRFFIPKGTSYVAAVERALNQAGIVKINIVPTDEPRSLPFDREYPIGMKTRQVCNELLRECNYTSLWVDENGFMRAEPYITPARREITHIYETGKDSVIAPEMVERLDIATRPNVFIRVAQNLEGDRALYSTIENNAIDSPISIVNRGRRIVNFEEIYEIESQAALDAFVERIAVESTSAYSRLTFGTALMPTHGNAETLLCVFPELFNVPQRFHEVNWEMPLQYDGTMKHIARMVVRL
ncbi:MAG: hypothetical protein FWB96_13240 [Defluviitaleaceae bacterium]|nr:hypothetical protein [Defluviitaleaceae bacterium]MCL2264209.1 hypothetical protein [Defluviitaleaceae bacterium]